MKKGSRENVRRAYGERPLGGANYYSEEASTDSAFGSLLMGGFLNRILDCPNLASLECQDLSNRFPM